MRLIICIWTSTKDNGGYSWHFNSKTHLILKYTLYVCKEKCLFTNLYEFLCVQKKYNLLHINSKRNKDKLEHNTHKEISGALLGSEPL